MTTICIIGVGYVGLTLSCVLADSKDHVIGIDTNENHIKMLTQGILPLYEPGLAELFATATKKDYLTFTSDYSSIAQADVVIITVGTPLDDEFKANLSPLQVCVQSIIPFLKREQMLVLKSTVTPGVTSQLFPRELIIRLNLRLAFCPERLAEGQAIKDLTSIPVIVGGIDQISTEVIAKFWRDKLNVETICVADCKTAELTKLADNLWIDLNIALGNELAKLCQVLDVNVLELIHAANSLKKMHGSVNILLPSVGVGGSCLTKDPWFLHNIAKAHQVDLHLPKLSRMINDSMPQYTANLIDGYFKQKKLAPEKIKIAVLGLSYKNNTSDTRNSPAILAIQYLLDMGYNIHAYDPYVPFLHGYNRVKLGNDAAAVVSESDCVAFFAGHQEFKDLKSEMLAKHAKKAALVFDGRMYFNKSKINDFRSFGLDYLGLVSE